MAENVFSTIYMMRNSNGKKPEDLFPQIFESDDDEDEESDPISEEDRQQLLADMAAWQQQLDQQNKSDED
jgi:hypothetical protein